MTISQQICNLSTLLLLVLSAVLTLRAWRRSPKAIAVAARLVIPTFSIGLLLRALAPWGPHIASGRDFGYIDPAILGNTGAHTHLMGAVHYFLKHLSDPLTGLFWGQLVLGALCCSLVAVLTYSLCQRELPALFAGLLCDILVVAIRVDAGPSALVTMRFCLLTTLVLAVHYRKTKSILALAATTAGIVAVAYGRLESLLLGGLVLAWLAADPREPASDRPAGEPGLLGLGAALCLTMFVALVSRWLLLPSAALVVVMLVRHNRGRLASRAVVVMGICAAVLLIPRIIEVLGLERETYSRFPNAFLYLFGRLNILPFDPGLCTPLVLLFLVAGLWKARRHESASMRYFACVGIPVFLLYLLFMGDASARLKLQGTGIMLLLPMAGLGAEALIQWLCRLRDSRLLWSLLVGLVVAGVSVPLGFKTLLTVTTIQQEYQFLLSLADRGLEEPVVHALETSEKDTLIPFPRVIQKRIGIRVETLRPEDTRMTEAGALVFLGAGCRRFRDGEPLPGPGITLTQGAIESDRWPGWLLLLKLAWNKDQTIQQLFDSLEVKERPVCERLRQELGLEPYLTQKAERTRLEGRWMPRSIPFGLYRVTR